MENLGTWKRVDNFDFELIDDGDDSMYQCRGKIMYDEDHDEMPEPALMRAAYKLAKELREAGFSAEAGHSEKGWVEVMITRRN